MSELLPCPFCGHDDPELHEPSNVVLCMNSSCALWAVTPAIPLEQWNNRAAPSQWVSVEDRLPDDMEDCLVYVPCFVGEHDFGSQIEAMYSKHHGFLAWDPEADDYCISLNASHWMPLPTPPEVSE